MEYVYGYGHLFIVHASVWISFAVANEVRLKGLPETWGQLRGWLSMAGLLGILMGILTSHAHGHYMSYLKGLI